MLKRTRNICASKNTYVEILLCLYRECFAMIKNDTFGNSLIRKSGRKDLVLFYNLFSVLIVIVDACLSRWKDMSFFWNKKRKLLLWTKWTYDSDLVSESIMLSFFATGIDWAVCAAWVCRLVVGPYQSYQ